LIYFVLKYKIISGTKLETRVDKKKNHRDARKIKIFILKKKQKKGEFFLHLWKEIENDWQECAAL
jgi:hypothetical protein